MPDAALKVLLVEDDPDDALLLRDMLDDVGPNQFDLDHASRLDEALQAMSRRAFDVVLLDLSLPDSHGLETFSRLHEHARALPVVVLTGLDDETIALHAVQSGAQDYLVKGQATGQLLARAIRYAIERGRTEQRILHLNSVLRAIRNVNQLISREHDRGPLLDGISAELSTAAGYDGAWIVAYDARQETPTIVRSDADADCAPPQPPACLPEVMTPSAGMLVRHAGTCGDCDFCTLSASQATIVAPLEYGARVYGALGVITSRQRATDADELALVAEVATDAAYALHGLETEERRAQAETALRQSERKFRAIFEHASDPIVIYDFTGHVLEVNRLACDRLGYSYGEFVGMNVVDLYGPEAAAGFQDSIQRLRQRGHDALETVFRRRSGARVPVELSSSLIRYNERPAILTSIRDITSRARAEESQRMAAVGQLAAGVAHEFNNVLAGMSARAQVARTLKTEDAWEQLGESVVRLTARGSEIGKNLISFARPGEPQKAPISFEDQIEMALAVAGRELQNGQIEVERAYQAQPRLVMADAGQMQQVLLNIILNACHAMPHGGTLRVSTAFEPSAEGNGEVVLQATDTGQGIPPEHLPHVFEPFFTTKGSYGESDRPGAGLGLSVSHGLVAANDGAIALTSEVGVGTTCSIRLPAADPSANAPAALAADADAEPLPTHGEGRILLAEDEEDIRVPLALSLQAVGFEVVQAASLPEALRMVGRKRFKAVVSDLMMPGGDGRRILGLIEHMLWPPPVIFITGKSEEDLAQKLVDQGASLVMAKPVQIEEVVKAVLRLTAD